MVLLSWQLMSVLALLRKIGLGISEFRFFVVFGARVLCKTHQFLLVFFRGKWKRVLKKLRERVCARERAEAWWAVKGLASDVEDLVQLPGLHGTEQCRMENYSLTFELGGVKIQSVVSYCSEIALTNGLLSWTGKQGFLIFRMKLSHRDQLEMLGRNPGLSAEGMTRVNKSEGTNSG